MAILSVLAAEIPRRSVARHPVGAMASMLFQRYTGAILDASHGSYVTVFRFCGSAYLVALLLFHLLAPRLEPRASVRVVANGRRLPLDSMAGEREDRGDNMT